MKLLSPEEIQHLLRERPQWTLVDGKLVRDWRFDSFAKAITFVQRVAVIAEEADHHPDIDIRYDLVRLALVSHDAAGITARDRKMVQQLDGEFQNP